MTSEATRYATNEKDSYNITFGTIGGRSNRYNSPSHGKPSKSRKRRKHSPHLPSPEHHDDDGDDNSSHHEQSQPQQHEAAQNLQLQSPQQHQQGALQPAPGAYRPCAYAAPYPYQYPPPPYPNHLVGGGGAYPGAGYHVPAYPAAGPFVPHQGGGHWGYGYGNHNHGGGGHLKDVGLVGAAVGVASFGVFKLLRERRRYGTG